MFKVVDVKVLVDVVIEYFGCIDIFVNNFGVYEFGVLE